MDIKRTVGEAVYTCDDCDRLPPGATKERAWSHVRWVGHTVRKTVDHVTVYTPRTYDEVAP